jgi:hypothetical protein
MDWMLKLGVDWRSRTAPGRLVPKMHELAPRVCCGPAQGLSATHIVETYAPSMS